MNAEHNSPIDYSTWTQEQFAEDLRSNPRYQDYFNRFNDISVKIFIDHYAALKVKMFDRLDAVKDCYTKHQTQFMTAAEYYLDMILQKKLLDLECEWRAGLIDLPFIKISSDFYYFRHHIRECPFLGRITPHEINLCASHIKSNIDDFIRYNDTSNPYWVSIEDIRETYVHGVVNEDMSSTFRFNFEICPLFFAFYFVYGDTADLLQLPDVRGKLEEKYKHRYYAIFPEEQQELKMQAKSTDEEEKQPIVREIKEHICSYKDEHITKFVENAEDEATKEAYFYYRFNYNLDNKDDDIERILQEINSYDEPIPIESSSDWREALKKAFWRFKQNKIIEMLPFVYETYLMQFYEDETDAQIIKRRVNSFKYNEQSAHYKQMMKERDSFLRSRKHLDGKEDFEYYVNSRNN